ncbi:hypothetical protein Trco_006328 [Trichoderma cornu-damae]|uniref:O-methyltransferase C-terminal domain-containing protein n=1 Tax=Trichoderma cornu-damae TaxID=654480 RepID=A0A9P8QGR2_9HYPO|nr:hypothetical protein Trco_006328 [Trichoderma cornu-damae]
MASHSVQRMTALSRKISAKTKIITDHLTAKGLDAASFDVDGLAEFPISQEDGEPYEARLQLIALTKELHDIALGPKEGLRYLAWDIRRRSIWEFKIADVVPLDSLMSYENLAARVKELNQGLDVSLLDLRRLVRHAITNRIFAEPEKGFVAHSRTSRLIRQDAPLRNWVGFMCNDLWLPIAHVVPAMKKWPASQESTETGVNLAYKQRLPWFDFIQRDGAFAQRVPEKLRPRVQLTTHDFFTPQPVVAAAYFFRMIFHGFSDKYCLQILRALVPSLRRGAKVIVNDGALPEPGTAGYIEDRTMRTLDLFMQVTVNAREREPDDWRELFRRADARFRFNDIWRPEKSRMWFIEAEWTGE